MQMLQSRFLVATACAAGLGVSSAAAQVIASWDSPGGGAWGAADNWDVGEVPGVLGQDDQATIDLRGGAYSIDLDVTVTLDTFVFTSADATIEGVGANTITVLDTLEFGDGTAMAIADLRSQGTLIFTGSLLADICDTPMCTIGGGRKTGTGDVFFGGSTVFTNGDGSLFTIESSGDFLGDSTATFRNEGVLRKESPGVTLIDEVLFENPGTLAVTDGTLTITNPALPTPGVLGTGRYEVFGGSTLDLNGTPLSESEADVQLDGDGSSFPDFESVTENRGRFTASGFATFTFGSPDGLLNEGLLAADGAGSRVDAVGSINNAGGVVSVLNGGVVSAGLGTGMLSLNNGGELNGSGTAEAAMVLNSGVVSPGQSPGLLRIESPSGTALFEQDNEGTLIFDIEGRQPISDHDVLEVNGVANIFGGTLIVRFSPFTGEPPIMQGDAFDVLLAQVVQGEFDDIVIEGLGQGAEVDAVFLDDRLQIFVNAVPSPGVLAVLGAGGLLASRRRR
ncbi:MAG: hypothetical protein AAFX79_02110 [Planctomycetota bacterium]